MRYPISVQTFETIIENGYVDGTADEALQQIEAKQYALPYLTDPRPVHKIGVNISSETRTVAEWKEV